MPTPNQTDIVDKFNELKEEGRSKLNSLLMSVLSTQQMQLSRHFTLPVRLPGERKERRHDEHDQITLPQASAIAAICLCDEMSLYALSINQTYFDFGARGIGKTSNLIWTMNGIASSFKFIEMVRAAEMIRRQRLGRTLSWEETVAVSRTRDLCFSSFSDQ